MADTMTPTARSRQMALVRSKNTKPEILTREIFRSLGYRCRLTNVVSLPGKPDLVFQSRKKAVFVHGCFWHRHAGCAKNRLPKSNVVYWRKKFKRNVENDRRAYSLFHKLGWRYMVVWECALRPSNRAVLRGRIKRFMEKGESAL
ncbi:MAG: very short patch repair endonuclease [Planctomycetota bacterium]|jgi:DNA mismatch endonuclease (patch repair protein)|nr:very short patch repair endonuclease [Planctomycetota bacterium]